MEIVWLEDFLAVIDAGGFSRAAETRHVTQSALSRRIKSLEDWVGTSLFLRTTHSVRLTPAGEAFRPHAEEILRRLAAGRALAIEQSRGDASMLKFASTHALSLTFFPAWLRRLEEALPEPANIQLVANHLDACEKLMLQGQCHFLLCHRHPNAATPLGANHFRFQLVGRDELVPVSKPSPFDKQAALHDLPGREDKPVAYLAYRPESGLGRIMSAIGVSDRRFDFLKPVFASDIARLLLTMTLEGRGMAWLPRSLIEEHIADGRLLPAGDGTYSIPLEIHIVRQAARQAPAVEQFWSHVLAGMASGPRPPGRA